MVRNLFVQNRFVRNLFVRNLFVRNLVTSETRLVIVLSKKRGAKGKERTKNKIKCYWLNCDWLCRLDSCELSNWKEQKIKLSGCVGAHWFRKRIIEMEKVILAGEDPTLG